MKAPYLQIKWIKTWRSWPVFIMSIGMPVGFFLLYSGMEMGPDPEPQKALYLVLYVDDDRFLCPALVSLPFPTCLRGSNRALVNLPIEHSKISIQAYYLSKIFRVLMNFMGAIHRNFLCRSFCA